MKHFFWLITLVVFGITNYSYADNSQDPFFPIEAPRQEGYLQVSEKHQIFYAVYGNPEGIPLVVLHGGPGIGCRDSSTRFFDLNKYNVVMFDQRGAMRSKPFACMEENTTQHSIEDIESLRKHLGIKQWVVFGGSWGSLLSILYGEAHPESCLGFILNGIFLGRAQDIRLFSQTGEDSKAFQAFIPHIPTNERKDLHAACYKKVMDPNPAEHMDIARAFLRYHDACTTYPPNANDIETILQNDQFVLSMVRAILHYASHRLFIYPNQAVAEIAQISDLPAIIIHGNSDINCFPEQAQLLHQNWKNSQLWMLENTGHSSSDLIMAIALVKATKEFSEKFGAKNKP